MILLGYKVVNPSRGPREYPGDNPSYYSWFIL